MLLPGLIALVAAVVIARVLQPVLRACERAAAGRSLSLKLALLSLARAPGTATVAIVFVSVSVGLAVFAAAYRSTLIRNDSDRAAFEVPLDYTVKQDPRFVSDATPVGCGVRRALQRRAGHPPPGRGAVARPARGDVPRPPGGRSHATPLAWRLRVRVPERARAIASEGLRSALQGTRIPAGAREFRLPVTIRGDSIHLSANIRTAERPVHRPRPRRAEQHRPARRGPRSDPAGRPRRPARRAPGRVLAGGGVHRRAPRDRQGAHLRGLPCRGAQAFSGPRCRGAGARTDAAGRLPRLGRRPGDETACRDRRIARARATS